MTRKLETEHRLRWALGEVLKCRSTSLIVAELSDREGISRRQARRNVARAYSEMVADIEGSGLDRKEMLAQCINALQITLSQALEAGHGGWAIGAVRTLNDLVGLGPEAGSGPRYGRSRIG